MTDIRGIKPIHDRYNGQTATAVQAQCHKCKQPANDRHTCVFPVRFLDWRVR